MWVVAEHSEVRFPGVWVCGNEAEHCGTATWAQFFDDGELVDHPFNHNEPALAPLLIVRSKCDHLFGANVRLQSGPRGG